MGRGRGPPGFEMGPTHLAELGGFCRRPAGGSASSAGRRFIVQKAVTFLFIFLLFLSRCIFVIKAFGASSFYSFLSQKCTNLYPILNYWNVHCFVV